MMDIYIITINFIFKFTGKNRQFSHAKVQVSILIGSSA